jgi:fibronectin type 3 domain-containing protein
MILIFKMRNEMKKYIKLLVTGWLLLSASKTFGQQLSASPKGVYLEIKNNPQLNAGYEVLRADEKSDNFKSIGVFTPVRSSSDLHQRMSENTKIFSDNTPPSFRLADTLWSIWMSPDAHKLLQMQVPLIHMALGVSFLDTEAVKGKQYRYRLRGTDNQTIFTTEVFRYDTQKPIFAPMQSVLVDEGESIPEIKWRSSAANAATAVDLWRKVRGTPTSFEKIHVPHSITSNTKADSVVYWFADSTALFSIQYEYYMAGRDPLGNIGSASDTVNLQVGGRRNIKAAFDLWPRAVDNGIQLTWKALEQRYRLQNIVVMRSETYDEGYELLSTLQVTDTVYVDYGIRPGKRYFYQVIIQGEANFSFASPRVAGIYYGLARLLPPQNVEVYLENGKPKISWVYTDTTDIRGFYVYRTLSTANPLEQISSLLPVNDVYNTFSDTTAKATTAYYVVAAVSNTQSLSPASKVVSVSVPSDAKVPATGQLRSLWLDKQIVSITWADISQTEPGIAGYKVYRKKTEEKEYGKVPVYETEVNEYSDTLKPGDSRVYAVRVVGEDGRESAFSPFLQVEAALPKLSPPTDLRLYQNEGKVYLLWNGSQNDVKQYHVYRSTRNQKPERVATIKREGDEMQFTDSNLKKGTLYYYTITTETTDGRESDKAEELFVEISS